MRVASVAPAAVVAMTTSFFSLENVPGTWSHVEPGGQPRGACPRRSCR